MVKGESYYRKFQSTPSIDLAGYTGTWRLTRENNIVQGYSGTMTQVSDHYILLFQTSNLPYGEFRLQCFNQFPDGFIECFNDEIIEIQ